MSDGMVVFIGTLVIAIVIWILLAMILGWPLQPPIITYLGLAALVRIGTIGKPRDPITPMEAVEDTVMMGILVAAVVTI